MLNQELKSKPDTAEQPADEGLDGTPCLQVFPLTTMRDIFNLPTFEQMVVCLDELKDCMMQARATNDLMVALVATTGTAIEKAFEWPEVLQWKDDGKGEVGTSYARPDGEEIFSIKVIRDTANNKDLARRAQDS
jgi:hypothetical protein